jgi:hypothetical protein
MFITMDALGAYKTYIAVKNHFNSKTYDYFKYNGRTKVGQRSFEQRSDKYFFHKLSKRDDILSFLAANFLVGDCWVGDLVNEQTAEKTYRAWKKRIESLHYIFTNDLDKLDPDFNSNLIVVDGQHPKLLKLYLRKEVSPETILILEDLIGFFRVWNRKITDKVIWPNEFHKLKKYRPFFTIDLDRYKSAVLDKFNECS